MTNTNACTCGGDPDYHTVCKTETVWPCPRCGHRRWRFHPCRPCQHLNQRRTQQ